ncbi:MAG TPA: hypothetical protein DIU45_07530 [Clostridium sp.]|nr:hypothetical protein [Clostridium sp.]
MDNIIPNEKEKEVLNLFYNRFYDLYDEIVDENFFMNDAKIRFYKIREAFSIYKELLSYEPIKNYLKWIKRGGRPPLEGIIADDLFSFVRNVLSHFPVFDTWNDVYINKNLATWTRPGTINKFLSKCTNIKIDQKGIIKYRIWEKSKQKMTYIEVVLPEEYNKNNIYLKDIISEKDGIKFRISLMRQVLDTQIENYEEPDIVIMSQVYIPIKKTSEQTD